MYRPPCRLDVILHTVNIKGKCSQFTSQCRQIHSRCRCRFRFNRLQVLLFESIVIIGILEVNNLPSFVIPLCECTVFPCDFTGVRINLFLQCPPCPLQQCTPAVDNFSGTAGRITGEHQTVAEGFIHFPDFTIHGHMTFTGSVIKGGIPLFDNIGTPFLGTFHDIHGRCGLDPVAFRPGNPHSFIITNLALSGQPLGTLCITGAGCNGSGHFSCDPLLQRGDIFTQPGI